MGICGFSAEHLWLLLICGPRRDAPTTTHPNRHPSSQRTLAPCNGRPISSRPSCWASRSMYVSAHVSFHFLSLFPSSLVCARTRAEQRVANSAHWRSTHGFSHQHARLTSAILLTRGGDYDARKMQTLCAHMHISRTPRSEGRLRGQMHT